MSESEKVGSKILFFLQNENLSFFFGVSMAVVKCNWKSIIFFSVFGW